MAGGIDIGFGDEIEIQKRNEEQYVLAALEEIEEMLNNGVLDKNEAARLKDQIEAT